MLIYDDKLSTPIFCSTFVEALPRRDHRGLDPNWEIPFLFCREVRFRMRPYP